jgi:hypothetical protein
MKMKTWIPLLLNLTGGFLGCVTTGDGPVAEGFDLSCDVRPYRPKSDEGARHGDRLHEVQLRLVELRRDGTSFTVYQPTIAGLPANHRTPFSFAPFSRQVDLKRWTSPYRFAFGDGTVSITQSNNLLTAEVNVRVFYENTDTPLPKQPFCRLKQSTSMRMHDERESNHGVHGSLAPRRGSAP